MRGQGKNRIIAMIKLWNSNQKCLRDYKENSPRWVHLITKLLNKNKSSYLRLQWDNHKLGMYNNKVSTMKDPPRVIIIDCHRNLQIEKQI